MPLPEAGDAVPTLRVLLDCRMADWSGVGRYTVGLASALVDRGDIELIQAVGRGQLPPIPCASAIRVNAVERQASARHQSSMVPDASVWMSRIAPTSRRRSPRPIRWR